MTEHQKQFALVATKELVAAKLSNCNLVISEDGGQNVADFIGEIYDKFVELQNRNDVEY